MFKINSFPSHLGFGWLKPEARTETDTEIAIDYFFIDKAVHRVLYKKKHDNWLIKDVLELPGRLSGGRTLREAVFMHFKVMNCFKDPVFQYVLTKVIRLGNINFEYLESRNSEGGTIGFYPAGRVVVFRLPVLKASTEKRKIDFLTRNTQYSNDEGRNVLKLNDQYESSIILTRKSGEREVFPVLMFEYNIILASIYEAAEWICRNNMISKEKHLRMIIQDVKEKAVMNFRTYQGGPKDIYSTYSILFKGIFDTVDEFSEFNEKAI
ncbi:hypothetical protein [Rhodohalobacter sulfatireducens]|uniref:Uncharacterized protein n=1 Tax=Rhodohalobacter sulfatireducens TaxID=2911366 RepID=A0ABS9K8C7_9BACT|nr:hypothetical protein [Rhodohalobacter sulfatireducens]MCG2587113.1 hypothetical protein [Rhodohalobacter sulfatireducens]